MWSQMVTGWLHIDSLKVVAVPGRSQEVEFLYSQGASLCMYQQLKSQLQQKMTNVHEKSKKNIRSRETT